MALTVNFSTSQSLSSNNTVTFTDTSTGSDGTITSRRIKVQLANGNYLTASGESSTLSYTTWAIGSSTLSVSLLSKSTVAYVTVDWLAGATVTYTKTLLQEWDLYDYVALFGLLSAQTSYPARTDNSGYWQDTFKVISNIFQSENAVTLMSDIYSSQAALDRNYTMISNQNKYF
jgi:hypothetical protein